MSPLYCHDSYQNRPSINIRQGDGGMGPGYCRKHTLSGPENVAYEISQAMSIMTMTWTCSQMLPLLIENNMAGSNS